MHAPSLLTVLLLLALPFAWRNGGPPERACILVLGVIATLDLAAWAFLGGALLAHAVIDSLALAWLVPIALKANRHYPALLAAACLVAASIEWLALAGLAGEPRSVRLIAESGHFAAFAGLLFGWLRHRKTATETGKRPAWRDQLQRG